MIGQRRNRAGREAGAIDFQPDTIEMPPRRERILTDRPAEQQDRGGRCGLGAVGEQRRRDTETIKRPEQAPQHKAGRAALNGVHRQRIAVETVQQVARIGGRQPHPCEQFSAVFVAADKGELGLIGPIGDVGKRPAMTDADHIVTRDGPLRQRRRVIRRGEEFAAPRHAACHMLRQRIGRGALPDRKGAERGKLRRQRLLDRGHRGDGEAASVEREAHALQRRAMRHQDIVPRGVGDRRADAGVVDQRQPAVVEQAPARRLDVVDARGQPRLGDQFAQQIRRQLAHAAANRLVNRCSRCSGVAPAFSTWRSEGALMSAIQVPPSVR